MVTGPALALALLAAAPSGPAGSDGLRDALSACAQVRRPGDGVPQTRASVDTLALRCSRVFLLDTCRAAWRDARSLKPTVRLPSIARACAAAYCEHIPVPRPELCTPTGTDASGDALFLRAADFFGAAYVHDHGPEGRAEFVRAFDAPHYLYTHLFGSEVPPPTWRIEVRHDGDRLAFSWLDRSGSVVQRWTTSFRITDAEAQALAARFREERWPVPKDGSCAAVASDKSVLFGSIKRVIKALSEAGCTQLAFGTLPARATAVTPGASPSGR